MVNLTPEIEAELRRRAAASDDISLSELLREALDALDRERAFEALVLEGMEGEGIPWNAQTMSGIREAGLARLREQHGK